MPKNAFGDEVQTNQFGDVVTAVAPSRPSGPGVMDRITNAVSGAADWLTKPVYPSQSLNGEWHGESTAGGDTMIQGDDTHADDPAMRELALRLGLPIAAAAAAPVSGGASIPLALGAVGGLTGEIMAQQSEMDRGARDQASYGRMVAAPIMAGVPLGPAASTSVRAFDSAGNLLAVAPQAILKRGAFGAGVGAGASAIEQTVDGKKINWGEIANSAAFGALFGGVTGGMETYQRTRAAQSEIFQLRKATGNFQGSDEDFLTWVKAKAQHRTGATSAAPAEEGARVSQEQIQAPAVEPATNAFGDDVTPPAPAALAAPQPPPVAAEPVPAAPVAPETITPVGAVVARDPHKVEAAGSTPAPAPIPVSDAQVPPPTEPSPEAVGGPAPAPASDVVNEEAGAGSVEPERIREDLPEAQPIIAKIDEIVKRGEERQAAMSDGQVKQLTHPFDTLTEVEKTELHALQLRLRRKSAVEAKADLVAKRAARKAAVPEVPDLQKWLHVEEPDVSAAAASAKAATASLQTLQTEYSTLKAGYDKLTPQVTRTTGSRWERGKVKKSAPAGLVKQWRDLADKMAKIDNAAQKIRDASFKDRLATEHASMRRTINDTTQPLIRRLAKRMRLENESGNNAKIDNLVDLFYAEAAKEIRRHYPDATHREIQALTHPLENHAMASADIKRGFEMDPALNLTGLRAGELDEAIKKIASPRLGEYTTFSDELRQELARYLPGYRTFENKSKPVEFLTTKAKEDLIVRAEAEKAEQIKQEEDAKKLAQELYEKTKVKGVRVITDQGVTVVPSAKLDSKVAKLATSKQLTAQREWLDKVLREQLPSAPDANSLAPEFQADYDELKQLRSQWVEGTGDILKAKERALVIAKKYVPNIDTAGLLKPGAMLKFFDTLIRGVEERVPDGTPAEIMIHVPGDGVYRIPNWKPTIEEAIKRFKSLGRGLGPVTISTPSSSARTIPKLPNGNVAPAEIHKLLKNFVKDDGTKSSINEVRQDGAWTMASDGKTILFVRGGTGASPGELEKKYGKDALANVQMNLREQSQGLRLTDADGNPKLQLGAGEKRVVQTDELIKKLNAVIPMLNENGKKDWVQVHFQQDGGAGISYIEPSFGDYRSTGVEPGEASRAAMDPFRLRDVLEALRKLGHEQVEVMAPVYDGEKRTGLVIKAGDRAAAIVMPVGEGGKALENAPAAVDETPPSPPENVKPSKTSGAAASPGYASAPPMQPPQAPFRPLRPADDPNFSQLPFQLPEMVQFYRMISGGKNPRILERIRTLHGTALGVFRYIEGNIDSGKIELRADLFHLLSAQEKQKLMNDAVAWAKLMKEANPDMDLSEAIRHKFNELVKAAEEEAMKRDPARAMAVFAHEIGHYIDFLPDATLKRGNVLGHMATLKGYLKNFIGNAPDIFPVPPTSAERAALRRKAEKDVMDSVKEITETITREEPIYETSGITAKHITEIVGQTARDDFPEFYDWFARLSRAEKVDLLKKAMRGIVDERAAQFGKRTQTGTKTVTETVTRKVGEVSEEAIKARYRELLRAELTKRGLISIQDIKKELEGVIAWWHKRETMPAYFKSGVEMYAETFSVLINNPAALKERAPTWWKAFEQYLVRKPAVKKAYDQVQNDIKSGAIFTQRVENLRESFHTDEEAGLAWELSRDTNFKDLARYVARRGPEPFWWRELKDSFKLTFINQQAPIEDLARKHLGATKANKLLGAIQDYLYRQTAVEGLGRQINLRVEAPLASQSLTHDDMAEYLFHNRIVNGDAVQTANSQGWSPNTSAQRLEEMRKDLGDVRFNTLKNAVSQFRAIYEEGPLKLLAESRTLKPELMKKILENVAYAPFNVARDAFNPLEVGTIHGMIDAAYGKETTARIFHRIGYLGDIQSPYVALVKKAEILTKFAYKQIAIKSIRDFMTEFEPHLIVQAPKRYNGSRLVPVDRLDNTTGTIYTMDDGEVNGWYVPRTIYETLENATGLEQKLLGWALRFLSPAKAVLTELNFGFWPVNFARDIGAFTIQMRGGVGGLRHLPRAYQAAKASYTSTADPIADQILSRLMVISRADPRGEHLGHPDELNRWLLRLDKHPELWNPEAKKIGRLLRLWEWYKSRGQILERTVKTMGMMTVDALHGIPAPDENTPWVTMPEPLKREIVHELAGSPNFPKRGRGIAFVEVSGKGMFANAWMRGIEAFYKAQKRDPAGVWPKFLLFIGLPTLAAFLYYEMGWNPPGTDPKKNEEDRDMMRSVPERDKLRGVIHLLGWADKAQKKVAYVILPFPEQPRMLNAAFRKTLQTMAGQRGQKLGLESWLQYQGQDLPSKNPYLDAADKWWQLEVLNQNPYDSFRGKGMLDDDVAKAGQGAGQLARDTLASVTGGMIPQPIPNVPGSNPTELEKFLHLPVVGNLVGRWVRVSNAGVSELDAAAVQPTDQQAAVLRILGNQLLTKIENNVPFTDNEMHVMATETYLFDYMAQRFTAYQAGALGPEVRDFLKGTTQERGALIKMWAERSAAKQARLQAAGAGPN